MTFSPEPLFAIQELIKIVSCPTYSNAANPRTIHPFPPKTTHPFNIALGSSSLLLLHLKTFNNIFFSLIYLLHASPLSATLSFLYPGGLRGLSLQFWFSLILAKAEATPRLILDLPIRNTKHGDECTIALGGILHGCRQTGRWPERESSTGHRQRGKTC